MEYEYKVIFDDGKPFEVFCNSEYSLKKTLMDFYLSQKQVKNENYNAYVFNNKDEDISESQFIEEMIADILDGEAITTKIRESENKEFISKMTKKEIKENKKEMGYSNDDNGKILFIDKNNKPHTELDYVLYFFRNNNFTKSYIESIKKGNKKVLGSIPHNIWLKGFDICEKEKSISYE